MESFNESIHFKYFPISILEEPQLPVTQVVTPSKIKLVALGSWVSSPSRWVCTSIKPGATIIPFASIVFAAERFTSLPILMILPSLMARSEEHTSELQSLRHLVCRLLL